MSRLPDPDALLIRPRPARCGPAVRGRSRALTVLAARTSTQRPGMRPALLTLPSRGHFTHSAALDQTLADHATPCKPQL